VQMSTRGNWVWNWEFEQIEHGYLLTLVGSKMWEVAEIPNHRNLPVDVLHLGIKIQLAEALFWY